MIEEEKNISKINEWLKAFDTTPLTQMNSFSKFFIYKEKEELGFIQYSIMYERAEVEYIFVKEEMRRKGIAQKLLSHMICDCKKNNCNQITLEVRISNIEAIHFYEKNGFKTIHNRKNYYQKEDALLMEKVIE